MNYKVLYRKYRPTVFDEIYDQEYTVKMLKNAITRDKISHAYLFTGPRGTGKTSTAKIFAKAINCVNSVDGNPCNTCDMCNLFHENPDIIEIDAASNNGVDEIRELINNIKLVPSYSRYKVYIIDEVHMLSTSAFNALLLTLEEPPSHVVFILATTDVQNVPITILSRCQRFDFHKITVVEIINKLQKICDKEDVKISEEALKEIAYISDGGLRDAESILDQIIGSGDKEITLEDISRNFGTISTVALTKLLEALFTGNIEVLVDSIAKIANTGVESGTFILKLIDLLKKEAIKSKQNNETLEIEYEDIVELVFDLNKCLLEGKTGVDPYVLVELSLLKHVKNELVINDLPVIVQENNEPSDIVAQEEPIPSVEEYEDAKTGGVNADLIVKFQQVRVNNCFVNAKKEYLEEIKELWPEYVETVKTNLTGIYNQIVDTSVVAASDEYMILSHNSDTAVNSINEKHVDLENVFEQEFELLYKIVAIDQESWEKEKKLYVKNLKDGNTYKLVKDVDITVFFDKKDEIEELANQIFNEECIEIQ